MISNPRLRVHQMISMHDTEKEKHVMHTQLSLMGLSMCH